MCCFYAQLLSSKPCTSRCCLLSQFTLLSTRRRRERGPGRDQRPTESLGLNVFWTCDAASTDYGGTLLFILTAHLAARCACCGGCAFGALLSGPHRRNSAPGPHGARQRGCGAHCARAVPRRRGMALRGARGNPSAPPAWGPFELLRWRVARYDMRTWPRSLSNARGACAPQSLAPLRQVSRTCLRRYERHFAPVAASPACQ